MIILLQLLLTLEVDRIRCRNSGTFPQTPDELWNVSRISRLVPVPLATLRINKVIAIVVGTIPKYPLSRVLITVLTELVSTDLFLSIINTFC